MTTQSDFISGRTAPLQKGYEAVYGGSYAGLQFIGQRRIDTKPTPPEQPHKLLLETGNGEIEVTQPELISMIRRAETLGWDLEF